MLRLTKAFNLNMVLCTHTRALNRRYIDISESQVDWNITMMA